jgi:hypothetical protein
MYPNSPVSPKSGKEECKLRLLLGKDYRLITAAPEYPILDLGVETNQAIVYRLVILFSTPAVLPLDCFCNRLIEFRNGHSIKN